MFKIVTCDPGCESERLFVPQLGEALPGLSPPAHGQPALGSQGVVACKEQTRLSQHHHHIAHRPRGSDSPSPRITDLARSEAGSSLARDTAAAAR